jgi:trimeric autotransporter adhesin
MKQFYAVCLCLSLTFLALCTPQMAELYTTIQKTFNKAPTPQLPKTKGLSNEKKGPLSIKADFKGIPFVETDKPQSASLFAVSVGATLSAAVVTDNAPTGASATDVLEYTAVLTNSGTTDATGVTFTDVLDNNTTLVAGSVKATPVAVNETYNCIGNVGLTVNTANGVRGNDVSPDNSTLSITAATNAATTQGGTINLAADGSFTYMPAVGFNGDDTYTYTLNNAHGQTTTATITFAVSTPIWFINSAYVGGGSNGTLAKPFTTVNAFQAINDAANTNRGENGDFIFLYSGTYSSSALTLRNSQELIGQAATSSITSITGISVPTYSNTLPSTGGSATAISNTTATPITLGSGNEIQGVNFSSTSGTTMSGASVGALKIRNVSLSASAGQALLISAGGALDIQFITVSATGAAKGISINGSTGSFQILGSGTTAGSGGTINNITNRGVEFISCTNITLKHELHECQYR